jgi:hypothetical protein
MHPEDQPYMAVAEVAAYFDVTRHTVLNWRVRGEFPAPTAVLRMGPVWATDAIVKFKAVKDRPREKVDRVLRADSSADPRAASGPAWVRPSPSRSWPQ